jgi:hypothetical protein
MTNFDLGQLERFVHHQYQKSVTDQNTWQNARMRIIVGLSKLPTNTLQMVIFVDATEYVKLSKAIEPNKSNKIISL